MILRCLTIFQILAMALSALGQAEEFASSEKEMTIESFLQTLSTVPGTVGRRDPFAQVQPPFGVIEGPMVNNMAVNSQAGPLLRYPVTEYEVVAVLVQTDVPRALIRVPQDPSDKGSRVLILKEKDILGSLKGVVTKITKEGVIVQQATHPKRGAVERWDTLLKVGATSEMQRRLAEEQAQKQRDSGKVPGHSNSGEIK